jgi:hypothetical protein
MKKNNIAYTTTARNVTWEGGRFITVLFKESSKPFVGKLGQLQDWIAERDVVGADGKRQWVIDTPVSCITAEGRHGIYPVIYANTERAAIALSMLAGGPIAVDEGMTLYRRSDVRAKWRALKLAGIDPTTEVEIVWGITREPYAETPVKAEAEAEAVTA